VILEQMALPTWACDESGAEAKISDAAQD
jgi:hypothetical protein